MLTPTSPPVFVLPACQVEVKDFQLLIASLPFDSATGFTQRLSHSFTKE